MTNGDRIRAMTDEQLADFLLQNRDCYTCDLETDKCEQYTKEASAIVCRKLQLAWLRQEESESGTDWVYEKRASSPPSIKGEWRQALLDGLPYADEWYRTVYVCSVCGGNMLGRSDFCPWCGADMRESNEKEANDG